MIEVHWHPYRPDPTDRSPAGGHWDFPFVKPTWQKKKFLIPKLILDDSIVIYAQKLIRVPIFIKIEAFLKFRLL